MKKYTLFIFLFVNLSVYAQQWEWAKTIETNLPIRIDGSQVRLAPDKHGNFYLSYFQWDNNYGYPDGSAIAKYDSIGNELWQKDFTSKIRINDIAADIFGAFYITGDFRDTVYVDSVTLMSNGNNDAFLAKFNSSGNLQWIKKSGGLYNDCGSGLCLDAKGNIYMTGEYSDSAIFSGNWISDNISNMYVSKFDSSGNLLLFTSSNTPDSLQAYAQGEKIELDNSGNIVVLGGFSHMQIDTILLLDGGPYGAQFICKFDTAGQLKWLKEANSFTDKYHDFLLGDDNTIFATGYGGWTNGSWTITNRLDSAGNLLWNKGCGLNCGYYGDGILNGIVKDSTAIIAYGNGSCNGLLLVKYAFDGSLVYLDTIPADGYIAGKSIFRDSKGKYIISGFIHGAIKLGSDSIYSSTEKIFIAKFSDNTFISSIENQKQNFELIRVFPNPSSGIFTVQISNYQAKAKVTVRDVLGNCLFEKDCRGETSQEINLSCHPGGIYFVELLSGENRVVRKVAIQ